MQNSSNTQFESSDDHLQQVVLPYQDRNIPVIFNEYQLSTTTVVDNQVPQNVHHSPFDLHPHQLQNQPQIPRLDNNENRLPASFEESSQNQDQFQQMMEEFFEVNNFSMSFLHIYLFNVIHKTHQTLPNKTWLKLIKMRRGIHKCSICYETIKKNIKIPKLACNHKFHKKCLTKWVSQKANCPVCRNHIE